MARRLLLLNGLATLGVVLNHASSWVFIGMFWWTDRYRDVSVPNFERLGSPAYYFLRVVEQLIAFTVPSFLFVSGFFIAFVAGREPLQLKWATSGKRIRTLVVPYLIWSTVLLLEKYISGSRYTATQYLRIYLTGRAADPYYYVPLVCQYFILAPLLIECARRNWKGLLLATGLLQLTVQSVRYPMYLGVPLPDLETVVAWTPGWFFPGKVFWFAFGIVASLYLEDFQKGFLRYRWHCVVLGALLVPLGVLEWEVLRLASPTGWIPYYDTTLDSLYAGVFIVALIAFSGVVPPFAERIQDVGRHSYGVYLVHSIVLIYTARVMYFVFPRILEQSLLYFLFLVLMGLGVPLVAMKVVRQSRFNGIHKYVFG